MGRTLQFFSLTFLKVLTFIRNSVKKLQNIDVWSTCLLMDVKMAVVSYRLNSVKKLQSVLNTQCTLLLRPASEIFKIYLNTLNNGLTI